jgi:hypothetical protein
LGGQKEETKMELILIDDQGASETTRARDFFEIRDQIAKWSDPEVLTARVYLDGECLYDGPATEAVHVLSME